MKRLGRIFWMFLSALVLCTCVIVIVVACTDDEKCKECTNSKLSKTEKLCGDDLTEAQRPDSDWTCK